MSDGLEILGHADPNVHNGSDRGDDGRLYGVKKDTLIKVAVLAASIFIIMIVLEVHGGNFNKLMSGNGTSNYSFDSGKKSFIAQNFTGICIGLGGLAAVNAYMFSKREAFSTEKELLKKVNKPSGGKIEELLTKLQNAKSKSEMIEKANEFNKDVIKRAIETIENNKESHKISIVISLLKRCKEGEFKSKIPKEIKETIDKEEKLERQKLYAAIAVALFAIVLFSIMAHTISTDASYDFTQYNELYEYYGHWNLNSDYVYTGVTAAALGGLSIGYALGRYPAWFEDDKELRAS